MEDKKETVENENVEETEKVDTQSTQKTEEEAVKTFTQEEVNSFLKKEKEKILKGVPTKEELKAFKDWQESQKTAEEKQSEKEKEYQNTLSKNQSLTQENEVLKSGVNIDDIDYVIFKVSKMEGDFSDNLKDFLQENPKYLTSNKEDKEQEINLGGNHQDGGNTDLSKMSYEEYKAYRKNNK